MTGKCKRSCSGTFWWAPNWWYSVSCSVLLSTEELCLGLWKVWIVEDKVKKQFLLYGWLWFTTTKKMTINIMPFNFNDMTSSFVWDEQRQQKRETMEVAMSFTATGNGKSKIRLSYTYHQFRKTLPTHSISYMLKWQVVIGGSFHKQTDTMLMVNPIIMIFRVCLGTHPHSTLIAKSAFQEWRQKIHSQTVHF